MSLDDKFLQYPQRRYGMDHDRYPWSQLADRPPVTWPANAKLALWVNVNLQFYPLDQQGEPFKVPGGMTMPYPDLRHYTLRDYGNRVGIFRILDALDKYEVPASFALNTRLAERYPFLLDTICSRDADILCHGWHMDALHYGGQDIEEETGLIKRSLERLRELSGNPVKGWISPARNESSNTPDLLAANDVSFFCDWVNDDMPYAFATESGPITAMPLSNELEDRFILAENLHSEASYAQQIRDACDFLLAEAEQKGGRMLGLSIHPWLLGQPHRIKMFEELLSYLTRQPDVWCTGPEAILAACQPS